ncbi:hypothetical protein GCM10009557_06270 [Virgisporangium ochraceum]|uniref:FAD/NAD(P)-binding domain-containing protein n=1 Tax=Virgisporangium ochraceum TaxID=65505 RepID=A0A8J4A3Y2_9ACTN|nr:NAD(P)/FAD-dependent oxidoreductase [Virgisporangium ochraceum]GIJ75259.1 hypothetical protein Voc01_101760 [Virgisporangium ochraceum]
MQRPSKALLRPVEVRSNARDLAGSRVGAVDVAAVPGRRDVVVRWALGAGIDVVLGQGRLDGARAVVVTGASGGERRLTARHAVVLDTGSTPLVPPVPGLAGARPWTSRDVTYLHEIPARVLLIGGGCRRLSDGETVVADEVVVATGSIPNSAGLGLESVGLALGPGEPGRTASTPTSSTTAGFRRSSSPIPRSVPSDWQPTLCQSAPKVRWLRMTSSAIGEGGSPLKPGRIRGSLRVTERPQAPSRWSR